jgi:hypothetical protein
MHNPYLELTEEFNRGRLAIMSKDGDWILREDEEAAGHVLEVLAERGARYRFGAPLERRWLAGGWSAHLEFRQDDLRLRTDFVSRPPRIAPEELAAIWRQAEATGDEVIGLVPLAALKLTNREKDYAVVGELARRMTDPRLQLLYSRSSRDLIQLGAEEPEALVEVTYRRPLLAKIAEGRDALDEALDRERRVLMRVNEDRLARYQTAAEPWAAIWPEVQRQIADLPLAEAHRRLIERAEGVLPYEPLRENGS